MAGGVVTRVARPHNATGGFTLRVMHSANTFGLGCTPSEVQCAYMGTDQKGTAPAGQWLRLEWIVLGSRGQSHETRMARGGGVGSLYLT